MIGEPDPTKQFLGFETYHMIRRVRKSAGSELVNTRRKD